MVFKTLTSFPKGQKCQLCLTAKVDPEALGNICQTADVIVHYFCLLLASKIQQKGTDKQGLLGFFSRDIKKEIKRGSTIVCNYCKKNGATVMCSRENCHLNFHVPCAQQKGSLHQFFNQFKSFCEKHKPNQKIPATLKKRRDLECVLCCSHIKFNVRSHEDDPIWPTCCKPQALLHKRCLQHFATSSGYYFKCPFCSNKEEFHKGMKTFGIFIPEQEASWETEPNAYRELLERDISCDAVRCRSPRGRVYSVRNSKWYLEVCVLCGASGRHRGCMSENIMPETYECDVCSEVNKKFPNIVPTENIPESSPVSDKGECNETVQQSVDENISINLSLDCEEIVIISDSESENNEVEVIDEIPPPMVIKNVRKRRLPVRQEKRSGMKRQRLAEGGAETSSGMSFTIDEESGSPLSQATNNPSLITNDSVNNPQIREINFRDRESINKRKDNSPVTECSSSMLMIAKVCTLSSCEQTDIDTLNADNSNTNEVQNDESHLESVVLVSDDDNETDRVLVISDTDSESMPSSLLDSDSSLLDLSEIPESEKSLLLENTSPPPNNYSKQFPRRTQVRKKRRKKKKQATPKKRKISVKNTQNLAPKSNERSGETFFEESINVSSNTKNLESPSYSGIANANISTGSLLANESSEEESFRGFCSEEIQSNNESVGISTPIVDESILANKKTYINDEKNVNSSQHMSGNHIFLSSVDDTSKFFTLGNLDLINTVKAINCKDKVIDEIVHPKLADDNTVKTTSNPVVLKLLAKDDKNYNKSVSNNFEISQCKNNNHTNAIMTSLQEECSKKSSIGNVICNTVPSELSRSIKNISEGKIDSDKHEVAAAPNQASNEKTNVNNFLIDEYTSGKETMKTVTKPVIDECNKSQHLYKTKRAYKNNNKPKIICSLALKQPYGILCPSLSYLDKSQHHKSKSCKNISSKAELLPVGHGDLKINFRPEINSNEVSLGMFDVTINQFFNVSYDSIETSQSPKKTDLHSKSSSEVFLEPRVSEKCSEAQIKSGSLMLSADICNKRSQSSEKVSNLAVLEPISTGDKAELERSITDASLNLDPPNLESHVANSQTQVELPSSIMIASETPLKSKLSENINEIALVTSSDAEVDFQPPKFGCESSTKLYSIETTHETDSQPFTEHSKSHQNSLLENHSVINTSSTHLKFNKFESESLLQSKMEPESSKRISEFPNMSDPFPGISTPQFFLDSSKSNSKFSSLLDDEEMLKAQNISNLNVFPSSRGSPSQELQSFKLDSNETTHKSIVESQVLTGHSESCHVEDEANLKEQKMNAEKKYLVNFPVKEVQSCKLEFTKSNEVLKNLSELTPDIKKSKPPKIGVRKDKKESKGLHYSQQKNTFPIKLSNSEDMAEICHNLNELKHKEQTRPEPKVEVDLLPSEESLSHLHSVLPASEKKFSQERMVSETHELYDEAVVLMESNVCGKPGDSTELNLSDGVSKDRACSETKYPYDDSHVTPPCHKELDECFKNLLQANKMENLKTYENKRSVEIENNLNDIGDFISANGEVCSNKNEDNKIINCGTNEKNVFTSKNFEKEILDQEESKASSCLSTEKKLGESFKNIELANILGEKENKFPVVIEKKFKRTCDSVSLIGKVSFICNKDDKCLKNYMDENGVKIASEDSEIAKHDWYKMCISDCSTCCNTTTLKAKHNIIMNDSIDVCFYCKGKINITSTDIQSSQFSSACSCQENRNDSSVNYSTAEQHAEDLCSETLSENNLSKNDSLLGSDLNSNYKNSKSPEKQKSPSKDHVKIACKEINELEAQSSLNLSDDLFPEKVNMATKSDENSTKAIPDSIQKSFSSSKLAPTDTQLISEIPKIKLVANMKNDESTESSRPISQFCEQVDDDKRGNDSSHHKEVFKVKIILKEIKGSSIENSLMSHVELFWIPDRRRLRALFKSRYFAEHDKNLVVYTDVCGFRYARLFVENIPEKIHPRVVFETGGDISYYLKKLIEFHEPESPQIVLIVYGNTLIPDKNVFNLLKLASNLNNIKLIVTTVLSHNPRILKFNEKLICYSKKFGYHVWDITKIRFLNGRER